ncbi:MAG: formate dehydrogenase accessory sulfurtransferase FdhD [Flavobacteriales bacterium]
MNTRKYEGVKTNASGTEKVNDALAIEHPLSISINGQPFTLTMHTPGHEDDLIRGLFFAEGVYKKREGLLNASVLETSDEGFLSKVDVSIPEEEMDTSQLNKRNLLSVASCGICGKTELSFITTEPLSGGMDQQQIESFEEMFRLMGEKQQGFSLSGGLHAAAIFNKQQELMVIREDIGRHNAVDKCVGALLNQGSLHQGKYVLVSGRVSYEIITKCFTAGIPVLAAVSAPSSLAVDFAKELGIALYGFCREGRQTRYA